MEDTCVICGRVIPEGRQVCPACEQKQNETEDNSPKSTCSDQENRKQPKAQKGVQGIII